MTASSFWSMGGYARYVWPSIVFACIVLLWNVWSARRFQRLALVRARRAMAAAEGEES